MHSSSPDSIPLPTPPPTAPEAAPTPGQLPPIATLPSLGAAQQIATLNLLFEPCTHLHSLALPLINTITFASYAELIDTVRDRLLEVQGQLGVHAAATDPTARAPLLAILGAHPRLGEKKVESAQSRAEQANLHKAAGGEGEGAATAERLARLNTEYEAKFPGLIFVCFVNGRGRGEIMREMGARIDRGDADAEEKETIQAMCDIAKDRAAKLLHAKAG